MRLIQRDGEWLVTEWAWGLGALLLVLAGGALALHLRDGGGFGQGGSGLPWDRAWFVTAVVLAVLGLVLIRQRCWRFDLARREVWLGDRGLFYRRGRRLPLADLRRIGVPFRPVQDEGKRLGKLVLYHRHGVESFRPWAKREDHAEVEAIALSLQRRLGLGEAEAGALIQELLANGAIGDAIEATSQLLDLSLKDARLKVEVQAVGHGVEAGFAAQLRQGLPRLSLEQLLLFLLFLPLILLVLAFGRPKTRPPPKT